jgi:hypothetical protein
VKLPRPLADKHRLEPMSAEPDSIFCRPGAWAACGPQVRGQTVRPWGRHVRGTLAGHRPGKKRTSRSGPSHHVGCAAAARRFGRVCDASGESVAVGGSTQTMHRPVRADCAATCARKRGSPSGCSTAGGGRQQAAATENASSGVRVTWVKGPRAPRGHAGGDLDGVGLARRPTTMGSPVSPSACQPGEGANHCGCSRLWVWPGLPGWRQALKPKCLAACRVPGPLRMGAADRVTMF